jgi:putative spermidine/putrescine transport system ATP-binding protein
MPGPPAVSWPTSWRVQPLGGHARRWLGASTGFRGAHPAPGPPGPVTLLLRPEALRVGAEAAGLACQGQGQILETIFLGLSAKLRLRVEDGPEVLARLALRPSSPPPSEPGETVALGFAPEDVHVVPR